MIATTEPAGLLPREFFDRPSQQVAPALLGCVLTRRTEAGTVSVALTETEAYAGQVDPASHAYRGRTARNAVMFGPPGHAYVYFTYGMHFCVNLVCLGEGTASAVLLRAGEVIEGEQLAMTRRTRAKALPARDLARGPARLCQALGIDRSLDGADVCDPASPLRIAWPAGRPASGVPGSGVPAFGRPEPARPEPARPASERPASERPELGRSASGRPVSAGPRVGVSSAAEVPWRFWLDGEPTVSAYRPYARRIAKRLPIVAPGMARCNA